MNRKAWADPTVQAEFAAWADRFGMEPKAFEEELWAFAEGYNRGYGRLLAPVRPYEALVGTEQSWKMFIAPHRFPTRLQIAGRQTGGGTDGGDWTVLFEEGSPDATWSAGILRHERLRASIFRWGWPAYQAAWSRGCAAIARRVFADFDMFTQARCRFWKAPSPSPAQAASGVVPEGSWVYTRVVDRGDP